MSAVDQMQAMAEQIAELEAQVAHLQAVLRVIDANARSMGFGEQSCTTGDILDCWAVDFSHLRLPGPLDVIIIGTSPSGQAETVLRYGMEAKQNSGPES
jgi:hypothetical protein